MTEIAGKHWSEQRLCSHPDFVLVRYQMSNGSEQITDACAHCGHRAGNQWLPYSNHPNRADYPLLIPHPDPCDCHPVAPTRLRVTNTATVLQGQSYADYLNGPAWQERRQYFLARAMYRCQLCKYPGPGGRGLNVHHSDYTRLGGELEIDVIVLCRDCHARHHHKLGAHAA